LSLGYGKKKKQEPAMVGKKPPCCIFFYFLFLYQGRKKGPPFSGRKQKKTLVWLAQGAYQAAIKKKH
jgi:hypothetical protein